MTALHVAAAAGNVDVLKRLLDELVKSGRTRDDLVNGRGLLPGEWGEVGNSNMFSSASRRTVPARLCG